MAEKRPYKYLILADQPELVQEIRLHCQAQQHWQFAGNAADLQAGVDLVIEKKPDIVFLVISEQAGRSALSLLLIAAVEQYLAVVPKFVLIAADVNYAIDGIHYAVFDFMSLPLRKIDTMKVLQKFAKLASKQEQNSPSDGFYQIKPNGQHTDGPIEEQEHKEDALQDEDDLAETILQAEVTNYADTTESAKKDKPLVICVKSYGDYRFINATDICYLKADNNSTDIHLDNGEMITAFKTLKHFEHVLSSPFVRIHNSYIVNIDYVARIHTGNSACYLKNNGVKLPFSKSYKENVDAILINITKGNYLEI